MPRQRGVTLIELMIVVGIIAILATIAYPSYLEQTRKGRRAAAKAMLAEVLQQQERFYTENNRFTLDLADLGYGAGPWTTPNNTHTIALAPGPSGDVATSIAISATPVAVDARCGVLTLTSTQARSASGTNPDICW
jgi:type IV pilus assembly protein PilE